MTRLCFLVIVAVILSGTIANQPKENKEDVKKTFDKIRSLYYKTAPDSMRCWFKWGKVAKEDCQKETDQFQKDLLKEVEAATKAGTLHPESKCTEGFAEYKIGVFDDPVSLPCSDDAFKAPKITAAESKATYRELLKLFNAYDNAFSKKGKTEEAGKELAKAIQEAEQKGILPKKCNAKTGTGFYSLYDGMPMTEMPCKTGDQKFEKPKSEKPLDMKKIQQEIKGP